MKCRFASDARTSSAVADPFLQRTSITRCSGLLRFFFRLNIVALRTVANRRRDVKQKVRYNFSVLSRWWKIAIVLVAVGFAWYVAQRPMDFRVYYYGAQGVLDGTRPVYGEYSGMGWPMH